MMKEKQMGDESRGAKPLVVLSERIGPLTHWELAMSDQVPCTVECRALGSHEQILANARDARVVIIGTVEPFDETVLSSLPGLGLVARRGVGTDNVDVAAAQRHGVVVTNVPDASVEEVSDHALALLVALRRGIHAAHRRVERGRLDLARAAVDSSVTLAETTLGVVGYGRIGRRLVAKAAGLFGSVLVADPYLTDPSRVVGGARMVSLDELMAAADAISLHIPLTEQTRNMIGSQRLDQAKKGAVVVNTARAGIIVEEDLMAAVRSGRIGGVGLDVVDDESPWRELIAEGFDNILLTGHTGARGAGSQAALRRICAEQVTEFLAGQRPTHTITPNTTPQ